jgi:hypothetical protein
LHTAILLLDSLKLQFGGVSHGERSSGLPDRERYALAKLKAVQKLLTFRRELAARSRVDPIGVMQKNERELGLVARHCPRS